jgi:hypothetical protein
MTSEVMSVLISQRQKHELKVMCSEEAWRGVTAGNKKVTVMKFQSPSCRKKIDINVKVL